MGVKLAQGTKSGARPGAGGGDRMRRQGGEQMDLAAERWRGRRRKGLKITQRLLAQTSDWIVLPKQSVGKLGAGSAEILKCLLQLVAVYLDYFCPS